MTRKELKETIDIIFAHHEFRKLHLPRNEAVEMILKHVDKYVANKAGKKQTPKQ